MGLRISLVIASVVAVYIGFCGGILKEVFPLQGITAQFSLMLFLGQALVARNFPVAQHLRCSQLQHRHLHVCVCECVLGGCAAEGSDAKID
jgi:hypothetical protein